MYETSFNLQRSPFSMTPDPDYLFLTACHQEALSGLQCAVLKRSGFVVLTGAPGTGKTTLLASLMRSAKSAHFAVVLNPTLDADEFLEFVLADFGLSDIPVSKARRTAKLYEFLLEAQTKGHMPVLIVDEAHKLSPEVLEEIRLLTNFESTKRKLIQVVLAGQSELGTLLNRDDLRQVKQRIEIRLQVRPLAHDEVASYIRHRWICAGGSAAIPFSAEALTLIARASHGVPRLVNSICDNALLLAHATKSSWITVDEIRHVLCDLDMLDPLDRASVSSRVILGDGGSEREERIIRGAFRKSTSGPPFIMRLVSKLNLGTVQIVKASQEMEI